VPALLATIVAVLFGRALPIGGAEPLVVLSGLAVIIAVGDSVALFHQRILGYAWAGLLWCRRCSCAGDGAVAVAAGTDLKIEQPANAMGRFFAKISSVAPAGAHCGHRRRRHRDLIALAAPSRPSVYSTPIRRARRG